MELKEVLGEDLYNQVAEQLKGKGPQGKDIEIVATNTGEYVPATKYEALKEKFNKVDTDYKTLNSNYESKINELNASKEKDIKRILVDNYLEKANVVKVNSGYSYLAGTIDIDKVALDNGKLVDTDNVLKGFIDANPALIKASQETKKDDANESGVPAANGVNPVNPQSNVKDRNYYMTAYKDAKSLEDKMALKREAGENGIII